MTPYKNDMTHRMTPVVMKGSYIVILDDPNFIDDPNMTPIKIYGLYVGHTKIK